MFSIKQIPEIVYKSRGLCAIFQLFGPASIQVLLLFESGICNLLSLQNPKSGLAHVKMKEKLDIQYLQNYFKCKQAFGIRKAVGFSPKSTTLDSVFQATVSIRVRLIRQLELGESAASIRVRLLIKCGFYTRLYGTLAHQLYVVSTTAFRSGLPQPLSSQPAQERTLV